MRPARSAWRVAGLTDEVAVSPNRDLAYTSWLKMPSWSLQNSRKAQRIIYYSPCDDSECKSFHYNICVECVAVRNKKAGFVVA